MIAYQFGDSIQIVLANALRGLSDVTSIMVISFVSYFIIAIPAGYALAFFLNQGIAGIWMSYPDRVYLLRRAFGMEGFTGHAG
ncbi:MAG: hypothetical protein ACLTOV_10695 [Phocaeicola sp.]